jgi:hypothetical protein
MNARLVPSALADQIQIRADVHAQRGPRARTDASTMRRVREILRLKFAANVPIREIAWLVGTAPSTVRDGAGTLSSGGADLAAARACQ